LARNAGLLDGVALRCSPCGLRCSGTPFVTLTSVKPRAAHQNQKKFCSRYGEMMGLLQNLGKVSNSLYLLFERSQATQSGLRKRKAPERRRTELNGVNGDIVCGEVFRPPLSAPQLSRALRREQQRATYPKRQAPPQTSA